MDEKKRLRVWKVQAAGTEKSYKAFAFQAVLALTILAGCVRALFQTWGLQQIGSVELEAILIGILGLAGSLLSELVSGKHPLGKWIGVIPWLILIVLTAIGGYFSGARLWLNQIIGRWNVIHEGGVRLFEVEMTRESVLAFSCLAMLICGQLLWWIVAGRHLIIGGILESFWGMTMLLGGTFDALTVGILVLGFLGIWISDGREGNLGAVSEAVTFRSAWWCLVLLLVIGLCVGMDTGKKMVSVEQFRQNVKQGIHEFRYGKDVLPQGDLRKADTLQTEETTMLSVTPEQTKTFYLRAFAGGVYEDGVWKKLPGSAYGGDYAGMLEWLKQQDFDPLTQSADYYRLSRDGAKEDSTEDLPDENVVHVQVNGASRYYVYVPSSVEQIVGKKAKEKKDSWFAGKGLFGAKTYDWKEISGSRPAELTVAKAWVSEPVTEEQTRYSRAEAVYREFVYENYLTVDSCFNDLMQEMFWKDYASESDGIYSALCRIREVLIAETDYTEEPVNAPADQDPVVWFLTEKKEGNSMLYASTAVEAFRAHGIPARYAEGYYLPATTIEESENGTAALSGEDAHAWVEVYFDGVGWLPVDVSPGYYYNTVELRQMIGSPDSTRKNAALKDNSFEANGTTDLGDSKGFMREKAEKVLKNTLAVVLGIAAIVVMGLVLTLAVFESRRILKNYRAIRRYRNADSREKAGLLEQQLYRILSVLGIEGSLGWNTREVEKKLTEKTLLVHSGDYSRCCEILEKVIYGEMPLEIYEERTLLHFLEQLEEAGKALGWKVRLWLRYI